MYNWNKDQLHTFLGLWFREKVHLAYLAVSRCFTTLEEKRPGDHSALASTKSDPMTVYRPYSLHLFVLLQRCCCSYFIKAPTSHILEEEQIIASYKD
jgi:hypothetical protein